MNIDVALLLLLLLGALVAAAAMQTIVGRTSKRRTRGAPFHYDG